MSDLCCVESGRALRSIAEIPYERIVAERVRGDPLLFYALASASFAEITSDLYTRNLLAFFTEDADVAAWLEGEWQREELQHGAVLKRYVRTVWPEFDWDRVYRRFVAEFSQYCTVDQLAQTHALEMAARCVIETGTACFYRMIAEISPEPVLRQIAAAISAEEVRHYKHFYRYFLRYRERERTERSAVLRTLLMRVAEIDAEDAFCAFKHVFLARNGTAEFRRSDYRAFRTGLRRRARSNFPHGMAATQPSTLLPPARC